jgi:hypothetical protein
MVERQEFSLGLGELNIVSTEEIEAGENFLNSDPNDISLFRKQKQKEKQKEQDEEEKEEETNNKEKKPAKVKEVINAPKEVSNEDFFRTFEGESDEEEEEQENEPVKKEPVKEKKTPGQNIQEKADAPTEEEGSEEKEENPFSTITKELVNHGIFTLDEEEDPETFDITTGEELLQRFQMEAVKQARFTIDKFIGRFGEDYQRMFESVFVHGVHPSDYLAHHNKIDDIAGLDVEDESNQERIVRELLRSQSRSAEYIDKAVSRMRQYGDLADEAREAQKLLVEKEQQEIEQEKLRKADEQKRKQQMRSEYVENVNHILAGKLKSGEYDGIPVNQKFAEQIFNNLTREKYQTATGQLLTEFDKDILDLNRPDKHELKVKVAMVLQLLKEDPTLSRIAKKTVSKESSELFKGLKKTASKNSPATKSKEEQPVSWFKQ